jgi:hypothetical protein
MQSSKIGLLVLATLVFAMPACFTIKTGDDDDSSGGSSGKGGSGGKGGSAGTTSSGGSSGSSGSAGTSGASGTNGGGSGGSSGSSGSSGTSSGGTAPVSCAAAQLPLMYSCPSGDLNAFTDVVCKQYYSCSLASVCSDAGLNCTDCAAFVQGYVTESDICFPSDEMTSVEEGCTEVLQEAQADNTYAQCNAK